MEKIFIQIVSYRDKELLPTLRDCISKAEFPESLKFGVVWQHSSEDKWDSLDEFQNDIKFNIIDIDYRDSKGTCWARSQCQGLWEGEDYTLQLDSHHRFKRNWDTELIKMFKSLNDEKAVITSYIRGYDINDNYEDFFEELGWRSLFHKFSQDGVPFIQAVWQKPEEQKNPVLSPYWSGHFMFAKGTYILDIPYDPFMYFDGEETAMAARSFTHGYNMYIPNKTLVLHRYSRDGRTMHWDDHVEEKSNIVHKDLHRTSIQRFQQLLEIKDHGIDLEMYTLGKERTLQDYENFLGLDLKRRIKKDEAI